VGQLIFVVLYTDERLGVMGERPVLQGWTHTSTLLWRRLEKARQLLTARDFGGLRREVLNYFKWTTRKP
jgi:hypothetical protein